jgi:hypothetical protein
VGVDSSTTTDSGTGDSTKTDSSTTDAPTDVPADTATDASSETSSETSGETSGDTASETSVDAGPATSGTNVLSGKFHITSLTSDDYAVVLNIDGTAGTQTISIAGGTAASVDAAGLLAFASGKVAFSWDQDGTTFPMSGKLVAWSASGGAHAISSTALAPSRTLFQTFAAAHDGSSIVWLDNAATDGSTADVKWANADGTGAITLFTKAAIPTDGSCNPMIAAASTGFAIMHCDGSTATTGAPHIDAVDATGAVRSLTTDTSATFTLDGTGANLLHVTAGGTVEVITFAGTKTTIDTTGVAGLLSSTGDLAVYATTANALKKSATTSPAPSTVLSSGVLVPFAGTPTLGAVLYGSSASDPTGTGFDLFLVDTTATTPAAATLDATLGDFGIFGDAFTRDGSRAIYQTGVTGSTYDLKSTVVSSGTSTAVATNVWDEHGYGTAAKIVYGDNVVAGAGTASVGNADLHAVDLAGTSLSPTPIALAAEVEVFVDSSKTKLVYASNTVAGSEGVYVFTLP